MRLTTAITAAILLATGACGSGLREPPRREASPQPRSAGTAYAADVERAERAGRAVFERYQAIGLGRAETPSRGVRRAVAAAEGADTLRCAERYEAVPIEGDVQGGPGPGLIAVYLVPEPAETETVPMGGFARITVDAETGTIRDMADLTPSCLDLSLRPPGGAEGARVNSLLVSHDGTPYPLENHVFASLSHAVELIVVTPETTWRVSQGDIRALD